MWAAGSVVAEKDPFPLPGQARRQGARRDGFPDPSLAGQDDRPASDRAGHHLPQDVRGENPAWAGSRETVVEGIFLSVEGDGGEPPQGGKALHFPALEGHFDAGSSILPKRRRTCSRWEADWSANGPPAPTGITPFTTIRKFPIPSARSLPGPGAARPRRSAPDGRPA